MINNKEIAIKTAPIIIEQWREEAQAGLIIWLDYASAAEDGVVITVTSSTVKMLEEQEKKTTHSSQYSTTWGNIRNVWPEITTVLKTRRLWWGSIYRINPQLFQNQAQTPEHYGQLLANGSNPKLLIDPQKFKPHNDFAAELVRQRNQQIANGQHFR